MRYAGEGLLNPGRAPAVIVTADERVPIALACRLAGMTEDVSYHRKVHCPFGDVAHEDGGIEAAVRVYDETNSLFCFAEWWYASPTTLAARAWDVPREAAADRLLQETGIRVPSWRQRWAELHVPRRPDHDALSEALRTWCSRWPGWGDGQFTPAIGAVLSDCLLLLRMVHTQEEADAWLITCKDVMAQVLSMREA